MRTNKVVQGACAVVFQTDGGSTIRALVALREEGHEVCGVPAICDRLAGGAEAIARPPVRPLTALRTIDEVDPQRPDRG
jgi:orotate phosphoribosyltransferase